MSTEPYPPEILTEGQRRHLVASLASVSAALNEIETLADGVAPARDGALRRVRSDLPPGFAPVIRAPLAGAREALVDLARDFNLPAAESSARRTVRALVTSSLVLLEDTATRNLRGYGAIAPSLPERLDPALRRLHALVLEIGEALAAAEDVPET
jgi:hypothetical protein